MAAFDRASSSDFSGEAVPSPCLSPIRERGRAPREQTTGDRFTCASHVFERLTDRASRRSLITYADFAFEAGLGSPRNLGWLLTPLWEWCRASGLPPLPIIVVRRSDGLPSGGYDRETIAAETARVFDHRWNAVAPPSAADLAAFALPRLPFALAFSGTRPC